MRDPYAATVPCLPTSTRLPVRLLDQQELEGSRKGAVEGAPTRGQRGAGALPHRGAYAQENIAASLASHGKFRSPSAQLACTRTAQVARLFY